MNELNEQAQPLHWHYYKTSKDQGILEIREILQRFENSHIDINTWFKRSDDIYWKTLENTPELLHTVYYVSFWDYIVGNKIIKNIRGSELTRLLTIGEIRGNTQVKLSNGEKWESFDDTALYKQTRQPIRLEAFQGISAVPLTWKVYCGRFIDIILRTVLSILIFLFLIEIQKSFDMRLPEGQSENFILGIAVLLSTVFLIVPSIEAFFVSFFGGTIGTKIFLLQVRNVNDQKLRFFKALRRQIDSAATRKWYAVDHKFLGAASWDVTNGVLVTSVKN